MHGGSVIRIFLLLALAGLFCLLVACEDEEERDDHASAAPTFVTRIADEPFYQETRDEYLRNDVEGYYSDSKQLPNPVNGIAVWNDAVYAATDAGLYEFRDDQWASLVTDRAIQRLLAGGDVLYAAAADAVLLVRDGEVAGEWPLAVAGKARALALAGDRLYAGTEDGLFVEQDQRLELVADFAGVFVFDLLVDPAGRLWVATHQGLYVLTDGAVTDHWTKERFLLSNSVRALALDPAGNLWIGTDSGLNVLDPDGFLTGYTGRQGLPILAVNRLAYSETGPAAGLWIGTSWGAARYDGAGWNYYAGRRWLPNDYVNDLVFDGGAGVWLATGNGASHLTFASYTLADKAARYQEINEKRHDRDGLVAACDLDLPGELSTFRTKESDNDGLSTGLYVAALSFQYAVTGDPQIKELADRHFAALALLQEVTGIPGLVARSVAPLYSQSNDPACAPFCQWQANPELGYDWKSDTGSDEITGHFFAYAVYYDLAADETHRAKVRELVANLMGYIVDHDYFLIDWDGKSTTWGIWNPTFLWEWYKLIQYNPVAAFQYAGPILPNSLEILSYLQTAIHITGEARFQRAYESLIRDHSLDDLAVEAAVYFPMVTNHGTFELLFLSYYPLLQYETDEGRQAKNIHSLERTWDYTRIENNSLFNTVYGALTAAKTDFGLPQAADSLRNIPLDLLDWLMQNSQRADVTIDPFPNQYGKKISDTTQPPLPPDERVIMEWHRDPFVLDDGGFGMSEEAGTYWLLPYWMARYHQFIQ